MKTNNEVAAELKIAPRTVRKWCQVLGFQKSGRDYLLTSRQVSAIAARCQTKRGRPPGPQRASK